MATELDWILQTITQLPAIEIAGETYVERDSVLDTVLTALAKEWDRHLEDSDGD